MQPLVRVVVVVALAVVGCKSDAEDDVARINGDRELTSAMAESNHALGKLARYEVGAGDDSEYIALIREVAAPKLQLVVDRLQKFEAKSKEVRDILPAMIAATRDYRQAALDVADAVEKQDPSAFEAAKTRFAETADRVRRAGEPLRAIEAKAN